MKSIHILVISIAFSINIMSQTWTWTEDYLCYPRSGCSAAMLDDSLFISGGAMIWASQFYNTVDIFDLGDGGWNIADLPNPARWHTSSVASGGKVFIAAGHNYAYDECFDEVNVYTRETDDWTVEYLSQGRAVNGGAVAYDNKFYFAGGFIFYSGANSVYYSDVIDIYDLETSSWTEEELSETKGGVAAVAAGGKVFFAGGATGDLEATDVIEIYDVNTQEWSLEYLSEPRGNIGGVAYDSLVFFAGGARPDGSTSTVIDVFNTNTGEWEDTLSLGTPRIVYAARVMDALIFAGMCSGVTYTGPWYIGSKNGIIEIYYPETGQWDFSVPELEPKRHFYALASYGDKAYFAGGETSDGPTNLINILQYNPVGQLESLANDNEFVISPNPCSGTAHLKISNKEHGMMNIDVFTMNGIEIKELMNIKMPPGTHEQKIDLSDLQAGIYYCVVRTSTGIQTTKLIKL